MEKKTLENTVREEITFTEENGYSSIVFRGRDGNLYYPSDLRHLLDPFRQVCEYKVPDNEAERMEQLIAENSRIEYWNGDVRCVGVYVRNDK